MAYMLNPYYLYKDPNLILDNVISDGVINYLEVIFHNDFHLLSKVLNEELPIYKNKEGVFWKKVAIEGCAVNDDKYDPSTLIFIYVVCLCRYIQRRGID